MSSSFSLWHKRNFSRRVSRVRKGWQNIDFVLWGVPTFLVFLAGILIASTQRQANYADWFQHWVAGGIGLLIAIGLAQLPLERLKPFLLPIYSLTVAGLIAVRLVGASALGAQRWLTIGGFNFQPSEFAKLTAILVLAALLERGNMKSPTKLLIPLIVIFFPWLLIFIQPDLGTSLVFAALLLTMLYWAGMPLEWVLLILSAVVTAVLAGMQPFLLFIWIPFLGFLAYRSFPNKTLAVSITVGLQAFIAWLTPFLWLHVLKDYQRDRLVLFLDPAKDPLGGGYHLLQSTVGIGSGGIFGTGLLQGQLTKLRFIPEQHTDFIFSALGEEIGFLGAIVVLLAFLALIVRLINVAKEARTDFESLVVIGVAAMLMFQVVVNIFMTIGLGPVTGIPLPFMSYGRSALLVNFMALGLCVSVARRACSANRNW